MQERPIVEAIKINQHKLTYSKSNIGYSKTSVMERSVAYSSLRHFIEHSFSSFDAYILLFFIPLTISLFISLSLLLLSLYSPLFISFFPFHLFYKP